MKLLIATVVLAALPACPIPPAPQPTPSPTATVEPSASPTATPTPLPTAFPTPIPSATPEPSPEPPQCVLPPSDGTCEDRPTSTSRFIDVVLAAQSEAAKNGFVVDGKVKDEIAYTSEVSRIIRSKGFCSTNGLPDEVWVKGSNGFSEHFDISTSDGYVWTHYAARCAPAKF